MNLSICAISDPNKLSEFQERLDAFIIEKSTNPFILSAFIKQKMESNLPKGSIPLILILTIQKKIVGVAPLLISKKLGIRLANFLFDFYFSPDFLFDPAYRELCMQNCVSFIFDHLGCRFADLHLPVESQNLKILEQICKSNQISIFKENHEYLNHSIIPIVGTWDDFQKSRGTNFRHHFRSIEKKLSVAGSWQITVFEGNDNEKEVLQRIMEIENTSWKQNYRLQENIEEDEDLFALWDVSGLGVRTYPDFKRSIWFLELNNHYIAYSLVIQYKKIAYVAKTSYDNQYRKLYPSIYTINKIVSGLFSRREVTLIDFMTNLSFMTRWTSKHLFRVRLSLTKGFLSIIFKYIFRQPQIRQVMRHLLPFMARWTSRNLFRADIRQ
jgi:hypothetical protein